MKATKRVVLPAALAAFFTAGLAYGQVPKSHGYVYQGLGSGLLYDRLAVGHTGVGGDFGIYKGVMAGADVGALYSFQCPSCVVGLANANAGYNFTAGRRDTKWSPFVTAGYSLFFRTDTANGFNYGGGVVYWFKPSLGLRLEVRDTRLERRNAMTEFRIGLSFR